MTIPSLPLPLPSPTAMTSVRPPSAYAPSSPSAAAPRSAYGQLLARLCERSVTKHHDAYADVEWDRPEHRIDARDPRFALGDDEPLADTAWYRAQPADARARLGLHLLASRTRIGIAFENILSRGLLEFAGTCARGSLEFRYAHHEVIEESQHSMMFQELVNRIGVDVDGMRALDVMGARGVPRLGRVFPELFFLHVLAGEAPIDAVQRRALGRGRDAHPLVRRIMQIHVTEEARHVCFASRFLEDRVPRLGPLARAKLRLLAPFVERGTAASMLRLPPDVLRAAGVPRDAVRAAHASPLHAAQTVEGLAPVFSLCERVGLVTPRTAPLWRWMGIAS